MLGLAGVAGGATQFSTQQYHNGSCGAHCNPASGFKQTTSAAPAWRLSAEDLSGLRSEASRIPNVPQAARMIGPAYTPTAGEVHRIGPGERAFAWIHAGQVCYVQSFGGGCVPPLPAPISLTVADPDIVGEGQPATALGLAIDDVVAVEVTLVDGRKAAGAPVRNFFYVELPTGAAPWQAASIEARMADGSTYTERLPETSPPPP